MLKTTPELFIVRDEKGPILYAPLNQKLARINESAAVAVGRSLRGETLASDETAVVERLAKHGFFDESVRIAESPKPPVRVTLFPTDGCNLRCLYCYAKAEDKRHLLSPEAARAAIDLVAHNAKEQALHEFVVAFHGNGEPFTHFQMVKDAVLYAKEKAEQTGLECILTAATNGVMGDQELDFLIAWFNSVNISCDVLPEVQNRQRPTASGKGTFSAVDRTLRRLDASGKTYGIRTTLTSQSVDRLEEIVRFVSENYPHCDPLHIEPAWNCGRCLSTGETTPDTRTFLQGFLNALDRLPDNGLRVVFSAARTDFVGNRFCAVSDNAFVVTAEGLVTSCYEVCETSDPRAGRYIYGHFDAGSGSFVFDRAKQEALHRLVVSNMLYCANCFCKYTCAGDCAAKLLGTVEPELHGGSERCVITRALTLRQLSRQLEIANRTTDGMHTPD